MAELLYYLISAIRSPSRPWYLSLKIVLLHLKHFHMAQQLLAELLYSWHLRISYGEIVGVGGLTTI